MQNSNELRFGAFKLHRRERRLFREGAQVEIGARSLDILIELIDAGGEAVSREYLLSRVWPNVVVEAENLRVQVHALRRALGADAALVRTVAGRGYAFAGPVSGAPAPLSAPAQEAPSNLPAPSTPLIGRDAEMADLLALQRDARLLTITGPGGIGKTRLALALAHRLLPDYPDGVRLVELSSLSDPAQVPATAAAALGLDFGGGEVVAARFARAVAEKRVLVLLDTCEHVIDAAAALAEEVLRAGSAAHILATSRESLRAPGEQVYATPPLSLPEDDAEVTGSAAVALFLARARAAGAEIGSDPATLASIAAICRRLDGIPLAIELAAARVGLLGAAFLLERLDDSLTLLTDGRRTALPRQQTLTAMLDWSHSLLSASERKAFRRLAIFAGAFSAELAALVLADPDFDDAAAQDGVRALTEKSLLLARPAPEGGYRLLDTTRAYARQKLNESGEQEALARRHAQVCLDALEKLERSADAQAPPIDDVRAALVWTFSDAKESRLAFALAAAAAPFLLDRSRLTECETWTRRALETIPETERAGRREMVLHAGLGVAALSTRGVTADGLATLRKALEIAEALGEARFALHVLDVLYVAHLRMAKFEESFVLARRAAVVHQNLADPREAPSPEWMLGLAYHFVGETALARGHLERFVRQDTPQAHAINVRRYGVDARVNARCALARGLWVQGQGDAAFRLAREIVLEPAEGGNVYTRVVGLMWTIPVHLWRGDKLIAEESIQSLIALASAHSLGPARAVGRGWRGALAVLDGRYAEGVGLLGETLAALGANNNRALGVELLGYHAIGWGALGDLGSAGTAIDEAIDRVSLIGKGLYLPELTRIKGELALRAGDAQAGETLLRAAIAQADERDVAALALRAAVSLARELNRQNRGAEALQILAPIHVRFSEAFDTTDLSAAGTLLRELGQPDR